MIRRQTSQPPSLSEREVLLLLLGFDKADVSRRGPLIAQMQFCSPHPDNDRRVAKVWVAHEAFLFAEARRLGIERPFDPDLGRPAFFGEGCIARAARFDAADDDA